MAQENIQKAIIGCRVSDPRQEATGFSLPAQGKLLGEYARNKNFKVVKVFSFQESAGGKRQRKIFLDMIEYARKNNIKIIIWEKVDRLTRNFKDAVSMNDWLEEDEERQLHLVKDSLILHKNSRSQEKLNWNIRVVFAQNYIDNLSEEVKKGLKEKLAQGWLPQKPPVGYKTIGEQGHKIHIVDKEKSALAIKMFELFDTGNYSIKALFEFMYKEGLRNRNGGKIGKSRMHQLLSNPFYYGKILWKGALFDGRHEPLISKQLFDSVQLKLKRSIKSPQYRKHLPVFKAKIMCEECGGLITWEIQRGHWYGHCNHYKNCSQKVWVRQEAVEEQLFPCFDKIAPKDEEIIKWLESALKESHEDEINYNNQKREALNKIIKTADLRMERAYRDKLDGRIPAHLCEKMMYESDAEKKDATEALNTLGEARLAYYEAGYAVHELALHSKKIYQSPEATVEEKRLLLSQIFSNSSLNEGKIKPNYTFAFEFLLNWMPKVNKNFEQQKTEKSPHKTNKNEVFSPVSDVMLRC